MARSQTLENTANTNTKHTWVILTGVSQWILTLFNKKTCMSKQKTPKTQVKWTISCHSHCWQTLLVLQLKRTKKIFVRNKWCCLQDDPYVKMCKLPQREHNFLLFHRSRTMMFRRSYGPWRIYIYIYIYIYICTYMYISIDV